MDDVLTMTIETTVTKSNGAKHSKVTQEYQVAPADLPALQRRQAEVWLTLGDQVAPKPADAK